ncbi:hypothetical protein CVS40_11812 [Lucilia cuprina]|nr:hypothetical protein CVS40_11812 [Lucilia cuprina]
MPLYSNLLQALHALHKKTVIQQNNICSNCLHSGHNISQCSSAARCQKCKQNHHTILHSSFLTENQNNQTQNNILSTTIENNKQGSINNTLENEQFHSHVTEHTVSNRSQVLLATANVLIKHKTRKYNVKALIDPGSQASFITNEMCQLLNLNKQKIEETCVRGIGVNNKTSVNSYVQLQLFSNYNKSYCLEVTALIMKKLTSYKPQNVNKRDLPNLNQFCLSDSTFYLPSKIDVLLGSDVYGDILLLNSFKFPNSIYLQESHFGWLLSGPLVKCSTEHKVSLNTCNLENQLRLFWEQEDLAEERKLSLEEELCEKYFVETITRDANGRYTVYLPFKNILYGKPLPTFNNTDYSALKRLKHLESSFITRPQFAADYKQFMSEYVKLNHMENIGKYPQDLPHQCFFLPHHGVLREGSVTTKLRVVFDASNKLPPQTSLNEELSPGPALQNELPDIITRWRRFKIAFTSDLEKMFRQIKVCQEHQHYQCIFAPFLAIRVLKQIACDGATKFPLAIDDVISGADTLLESIQVQQQLRQLLSGAGFNLRKWNSNSTELLKHIPKDYLATQIFELQSREIVKALGLPWNPQTDCFKFNINYSFSDKITKCSVLSDSARLFDPLGWLAPTTILAKIMFQKLWREELDWTDPLPKTLSEEWSNYRLALKDIEKINIPRWYNWTLYNNSVMLFGMVWVKNLPQLLKSSLINGKVHYKNLAPNVGPDCIDGLCGEICIGVSGPRQEVY